MKNSEVISAVVGGTFFAVPYLALSLPILPSLAIGATAFVAGELVFHKDEIIPLKEADFDLYQTLEKATKQNKHIQDMIPNIDDADIKANLKEIHESVNKISKTIEKKPEKVKKLKNKNMEEAKKEQVKKED